MQLGELKKALTRFPADMDETEVLFTFMGSDGVEYDNLAFVAYAEMGAKKDTTVIMLGAMQVALERMKNGTLRYADGTKPNDTGFDLNEST